MKINYVKGDMVKHAQSDEHLDAYAHQCNCYCRMGRGIAPQLAKAFSEVFHADNDTYNIDPQKKLGLVSVAVISDNLNIYNVYGQLHWKEHQVEPGRNTDYGMLAQGLLRVRHNMELSGRKTLGLPKIGCGLAGGDWKTVSDIIHKIFDGSGISVTVFVL